MKNIISKEMKRFNYLNSEIDMLYHDISLKLGLSDSEILVLYTICDNGGECCMLQDICRLSSLSKQTVNSAVRKLESSGMIYLENAGAKTKKVILTDSGKALADKTAQRLIKMENEIIASWPQEDVEAYLRLTERYLNDLRQKKKELERIPN